MKTLRSLALASGVALLAATPAWSADEAATPKKVTSDLVVPAKRLETVEKALRLAHMPAPVPVKGNLNSPFNPTGFDAPDPEDPAAAPAAGAAGGGKPAVPVKPAGPVGDRALLEAMAPLIQPTGSFMMGDKRILTFSKAKRASLGDIIEVTYNGKVYELEIASIEGPNFTLRFRGEEITRPIAKTTK